MSWRFDKELAGFGALGDLMSHVADMSSFIAGRIDRLVADTKNYIERRPIPRSSDSNVFGAEATQTMGDVTNDDYASALIHLSNGGRGNLEVCRVISGPVCQMAFEVHGTDGAIAWNLERMNELVVVSNADPDSARTILSGPSMPGQEVFWPGSGVGIGYESLVSIQAAAMLRFMATGEGDVPTFEDAQYVGQVQGAMQRSWATEGWETV